MQQAAERGVEAGGEAAQETLLVARDPEVIAAVRDAARRLAQAPPTVLASGREALQRLVAPGAAAGRLLLERGTCLPPDLLAAARDPFLGFGVLVVGRGGASQPALGGFPWRLPEVPAEPERLAHALSRRLPHNDTLPDRTALEAGLGRGEVTVRFQPMVRIGDRRPAMLEALARWESPSAALGPEAFVPMAERAGLSTRLTQAVAWAALTQFARLPGRRGLRLSLNVPLPVLLDPAAPAWLGRSLAECGLAPRDLLLELTESTEVRDRAALRAALLRLRRAGLGVLLDDLGLDDPRVSLLSLPFAGVKLDRALVDALPRLRRARAQAGAALRRAHAGGMMVIAEGVTGAPLWRAVAALGCDLAQGYGVGRPLPGAALSAWASAWSAAGRQVAAP